MGCLSSKPADMASKVKMSGKSGGAGDGCCESDTCGGGVVDGGDGGSGGGDFGDDGGGDGDGGGGGGDD